MSAYIYHSLVFLKLYQYHELVHVGSNDPFKSLGSRQRAVINRVVYFSPEFPRDSGSLPTINVLPSVASLPTPGQANWDLSCTKVDRFTFIMCPPICTFTTRGHRSLQGMHCVRTLVKGWKERWVNVWMGPRELHRVHCTAHAIVRSWHLVFLEQYRTRGRLWLKNVHNSSQDKKAMLG